MRRRGSPRTRNYANTGAPLPLCSMRHSSMSSSDSSEGSVKNTVRAEGPTAPVDAHNDNSTTTRPTTAAAAKRPPSHSSSTSSASSSGISTRPTSRYGGADIANRGNVGGMRPQTAATRRPSIVTAAQRPQSPFTRVSTALSIQSSSTSSDDYSIALPNSKRFGGNNSTLTRSSSSRPVGRVSRHSVSVTSMDRSSGYDDMEFDFARAPSRQSTATNYSILDTGHIHVYLQSRDSLLSIPTQSGGPANPAEAFDSDSDEHQQQHFARNDTLTSSMQNLRKISLTSSDSNTETAEQSTPELGEPSRDHHHNSGRLANRTASCGPANKRDRYNGRIRDPADFEWRSAHWNEEEEAVVRRSHYIDQLVWQVDSVLFCGTYQSAQNLNLLCRLNIECIVDLCGEEQSALINRPRPECPCLCSRKTAHSRTTVTMNLKDDSEKNHRFNWEDPWDESKEKEKDDVVVMFAEFINHVSKARLNSRNVLVVSMKGRNRAPAFVAAYLMYTQRCTRVQALAQIDQMMSKMRPGMNVSDHLNRALMRWQHRLNIRRKSDELSQMDLQIFNVRREAWSGT